MFAPEPVARIHLSGSNQNQHQKCQQQSRRHANDKANIGKRISKSQLSSNNHRRSAASPHDDDDNDCGQIATINFGQENLSPACAADRSDEDFATTAAGDRVRIVRLHHDGCTKLGFSLRGGKEAARSPVGVLVSHVEHRSEADLKGLKVGDLLLQVNEIDVNHATYEEVIGLIKQTPKQQDVLLKVTNLGRVPYQSSPGAPIIWIRVSDLIDKQQQQQQQRQHPTGNSASSPDSYADNNNSPLSPSLSPPNADTTAQQSPALELTTTCKGPASSMMSSISDEGIENYSYSSSCTSGNQKTTVCRAERQNGCGSGKLKTSATKSADVESICSSSGAGSISGSSASSLTIGLSTTPSSDGAGEDEDSNSETMDICDTLIRVPGGRITNESFGCDVVKGPDEWPGIFVQSVRPASLAQRCGLQLGDQLVRADGIRLQEMSFESAIQLIKRLQQQQDEMLLHVKKGAALRYLASCQQQQQQCQAACMSPAAAEGERQRQQQQQQRRDNNNGYSNKSKSIAPKLRCSSSSEGKRNKNGNSSSSSSSTTSSSSSSPSARHGEWAPNEAAPSKGEAGEDSGKFLERPADKPTLSSTNNSNEVNIGEKLIDVAQNNCRQRSRSRRRELSPSRGDDAGKWTTKATERRASQFLATDAVPAACDEDAATECCPTQQVNQLAPSADRQLRPPSAKLDRQSAATATVNLRQKQSSNRNNGEKGAVAVNVCNEDEGEIRIVSQSCKLHPHHPNSGLNQSQVLEMFPHPAARLQQQQQQVVVSNKDRISICSNNKLRQLTTTTTVDEMRRKLEPQSQKSPLNQVQRFKSMDNLAQTVGCPFAQQQHQAIRPQIFNSRHRPPRSSSVSRQQQQQYWPPTQEYDERRQCFASKGIADTTESSPFSRPIYRRSASVLGEPMECCSEQADEALRYMAEDYARLSSGPIQCCSLIRQQQQLRRCQQQSAGYLSAGMSHYSSNTLLTASRLPSKSLLNAGCRAQSMDRLNINMSYLKIGFNHQLQQQQQQQHYPKVQVTSGAKQRALAATRQCLFMQQARNHHRDLSVSAAYAGPASSARGHCQLPVASRLQQRALLAQTPTCCIQQQQQKPSRRNQIPLSRLPSDPCDCSCERASIARKNCTCPYCCCPKRPVSCRPSRRDYGAALIARYGSQVALASGCDLGESGFSSASFSTDATSGEQPFSATRVGGERASRGKLTRAPLPPAPPMFARADCVAVSSIKQSTTGKQTAPKRLTTFQSSTNQQRQLAAARSQPSDESSVYSQSYFSTTNSTSTISSSSSGSSSSSSSSDSSSPVGLAATLGRPELLGHQQRSSSPSPPPPPPPSAVTKTTTVSGATRLAPPQPPPPPASGGHCKLAGGVGNKNYRHNQTGVTNQQQQQQKQKQHPSANDNGSGGRQNRLCFVDELKMLAKRQQEEEESAEAEAAGNRQVGGCSSKLQPTDHSSTLIKIINASKSAAALANQRAKGCGGYNCSRTSQNANACCPSSTSSSQSKLQTAGCKCNGATGNALRPKCKSGNESSNPLQLAKSVKLSEEDNKRRQHEMLMKEFKSAHSRMFNKRREGTIGTPTVNNATSSPCIVHQEVDELTGQQNKDTGELQQVDKQKTPVLKKGADNKDLVMPETRTTIKAITTKKSNMLAQTQQVHLAAAN